MDKTTAFPPPENRNVMSEIIRPVDVIVPKVDSYNEKIIYIDSKTNETSYGKPWFIRWRDWRTYWVTSQRYVMLKHFDCEIEDLQSGQYITIDIMCRVQLIQGAEYKAVILLSKGYDIDQFFKDQLTNWIRQFASKHTHIVKNYFSLEKELMEYVYSESERHGIKIELFLSPYDVKSRPRAKYVLIKESILCQIKDWEIKIQCTLVMDLWDERRFKMSRVDDVEGWMKEKVGRIIQGVLIDKTITDLLQGYPSSEIQKNLEAEAYDIGFRVKQLISIPLIDALELLKGFHFDTEPTTGPGLVYFTKDVRVQARMNISIKGKINSFDGKVARYLKPGINLIQRMRDAVIEHSLFYLRRISPERFYFYFNSDYKGQGAFDKELEEEIRTLLSEEFNVVDAIIHLSPLESEMTERFAQLAGRFGCFTCQSISEQISYIIHYSVRGVDPEGWYVFKSRIFDEFEKENILTDNFDEDKKKKMRVRAEEELLSIGSTMRHHIELLLNGNSDTDLLLVRSKTHVEMINRLFLEAARHIRKSHGVVIEIVSMERLQTGEDVSYIEELNKTVIQYKKERSAENIQHSLDEEKERIENNTQKSSDGKP